MLDRRHILKYKDIVIKSKKRKSTLQRVSKDSWGGYINIKKKKNSRWKVLPKIEIFHNYKSMNSSERHIINLYIN